MAFKKKAQSAAATVAGHARRHYASRGGMMGIAGSFKPALDGGIGQTCRIGGKPVYAALGGHPGTRDTGYFLKNDTLMTLAGMHAGAQFPVAGLLGGITGSTQNTNTTSGAVI